MDIETISAKEIEKYIARNDILIVDLRLYKDFRKGHIPSAVNIPFEQLDQHQVDFNKYRQIVLYCERGNISLLAARKLSSQGYCIINICGGIHSYRGKLSIDD
jgi:rhodanese-related sulfurtransferase